MKNLYLTQPGWGVGHLVQLADDGTRAQVLFPAREGGPVFVSSKGGALVPTPLATGARISTAKGQTGVVQEVMEGARLDLRAPDISARRAELLKAVIRSQTR